LKPVVSAMVKELHVGLARTVHKIPYMTVSGNIFVCIRFLANPSCTVPGTEVDSYFLSHVRSSFHCLLSLLFSLFLYHVQRSYAKETFPLGPDSQHSSCSHSLITLGATHTHTHTHTQRSLPIKSSLCVFPRSRAKKL